MMKEYVNLIKNKGNNLLLKDFLEFEATYGYNESLVFATEEEKNNKDFVLKKIMINPSDLYYASEEMKNDKEILLKFLEYSGDFIETILKGDEKLKDEILYDEEINKASNGRVNYIKRRMLEKSSSQEAIINILEESSSLFRYLNEEQRNKLTLENKVKYYTSKILEPIIFSDEEILILEKREDLLLDLLGKSIDIFRVYPHLITDKSFILKGLKRANIASLLDLRHNLLSRDIDICKASIEWSTYNLTYFSEFLKENEEIMKMVIRKDPFEMRKYYNLYKNNLKFLYDNAHQIILSPMDRENEEDSLSNQEDFIKKIVSFNGINLGFASDRLRNKKEIVEIALKNNPKAVIYTDKKYWTEESWLQAILEESNLIGVDDVFFEKFKDNKPLIYFLISWNKSVFFKVSDRLKNDLDIVLNVLSNKHENEFFFGFIGENLKASKEFWYKVEPILAKKSNLYEIIKQFRREDELLEKMENMPQSAEVKDVKKKKV